MKINFIYAMSNNFVIGNKGKIPWYIPEDFQHFKKTTMGSIVVMGRKTWDSLPEQNKPLPGRINVVLTRDKTLTLPGAVCFDSIEGVTEHFKNIYKELWVIGGEQIFNHILPLASTIVATEVHGIFEGDALAPCFNAAEWKETDREECVSKCNSYFSIVRYDRIV